MAGNPFLQSISPDSPPNPVTPHDTPSNPDGNARVYPLGNSPAPAPYDISAPQDIAGITAATQAAMGLAGGEEGAPTGAGYAPVHSPRQRESQAFMESPQGYGAFSATSGFPDYENTNIDPGADMENPMQNFGPDHYPGTVQSGIPQFTAGLGSDSGGPIHGVTPEKGDMGPSAGMDYPGTSQADTVKYGTS